jgi:hypothetical protein
MDKELLDKELDTVFDFPPEGGDIAPRRSREEEWFIDPVSGKAEPEPLPDEKPKRRSKPVSIPPDWGD